MINFSSINVVSLVRFCPSLCFYLESELFSVFLFFSATEIVYCLLVLKFDEFFAFSLVN
jgi:hypothetical protein